MKRYIYLLVAVVACILFVPKEILANSYNPETVFDYADLLTEEEEEDLRYLSEEFEQYDMSVIFLTTSNAEGHTSRTYSDDFYDDNNFKPDGVLFLIDMDNREIYVNTVGVGIDIIDDDEIEEILDAGYLYVGDGEYFKCFEKMSDYTHELLEGEEVGNYRQQQGGIKVLWVTLGGSLVISAIVVIVLVVKHRKSNQQISAEKYMGSNFEVKSKDVVYMGCRKEVLRGYYDKQSGGSSHRSSGGTSHGGGGRNF